MLKGLAIIKEKGVLEFLRRVKVYASVRLSRLFARMLYPIFSLLPLQNKVIAVCFSGKKYGDNSQFIVEKLHHMQPGYRYVWMKNKEFDYKLPDWILSTPFGITVKTSYHIATSKVMINTHHYPTWIKKRKGQLFLQTWHGGLGIKRIEKDSQEFVASEFQMQELTHTNAVSDVFLSQSDHLTGIFRRAFGYKGPVFKCGYPKNDCLFTGNEEARLAVRQHYDLPQNTKVFLYAPTFRDYFGIKGIDNKVYAVDYELLLNALEKKFGGEWRIMVRWHPSFVNILKGKISVPSHVIDATLFPDMQELLKGCDIVMSDYSSCIFDAALLDIPCFTFATDFDVYKAERGVYYEMEELPFPYSRTNGELMENIANYDHEAYLERWRAFKERMGLYEPGNASQVIAEKIIDYIDNGKVAWNQEMSSLYNNGTRVTGCHCIDKLSPTEAQRTQR